jgi:hypothetical protein
VFSALAMGGFSWLSRIGLFRGEGPVNPLSKILLFCTFACLVTGMAGALAHPAMAEAWFGRPLPGPVNDPTQPVVETITTDLPGDILRLGPGPKSSMLNGARIMEDVQRIVGFSLKSKDDGQYLWGRVSGTPAFMDTIEWAAAELKRAGLANAHIETFEGTLTLPVSGSVRLLADPNFGAGSQDVELESAMVGGRGPVNGTVTAPMLYLGRGTAADLTGRDVSGKVAVIHTTPDPGLYNAIIGRQEALMDAGAVGVIEILRQPGNMQSYDGDRHGCRTGLCFTVGGEDGYFLQSVLSEAAKVGKSVSVNLSAASEVTPSAKTGNAVATLPGRNSRTVIVNAHADAWFVGANDNGDGLGALLALARYFANQPRLERTLVFIASAGHHNNLNGLRHFRSVHDDDYVANADLILNIEHVAAGGVARSTGLRRPRPPDYMPENFGLEPVSTTHPQNKQVGISNGAPYILDMWGKGVSCFGLSLNKMIDNFNPGELGAFRDLPTPRTQMISGGIFYHTTGEGVSSLSQSELERAARFYAYLIKQSANAPAGLLHGGAWAGDQTCPQIP